MTTFLVTGATGRVGRHVVAGLLDAGVTVRALVRRPELAGFPPEVALVQGDLLDPESVRRASAGADTAFLLWPSFDPKGAAEVVRELPDRVVYLSSLGVRDEDQRGSGVWGEVEYLLQEAGKEWTHVRPSGFAVNAQEWVAEFRAGDTVRLAFPDARRSLIHERDIAEVAVLALLDPAHVGKKYVITGPEAISLAEQVETIGRTVGKTMRIEPQSTADARQRMLDIGADETTADLSVSYWSSLVDKPEPVTRTVEELTGHPARTFAEWSEEHADEFRVLSTAEVAERYLASLAGGRIDQALALAAPDLIRVAPLEHDGVEVEHKGTDEILANAIAQTGDAEIIAVDVLGPLIASDHFAARFSFTEKTPAGDVRHTTKLSLCTVENGRITREEVFYYTKP